MPRTHQKPLVRANRSAQIARLYVWVELGLFLLIGIGASAALFWFVAQG